MYVDTKDILLVLTLNVRNSSDVVLGSEDKLVVEDPLWFVVQAGGGMQLHHLVILDGQVLTRPLEMCHLGNS